MIITPDDLIFWEHEGKQYCVHIRQEPFPPIPELEDSTCAYVKFGNCNNLAEFTSRILSETDPSIIPGTKPVNQAGILFQNAVDQNPDEETKELQAKFHQIEILAIYEHTYPALTIQVSPDGNPFADTYNSELAGFIGMTRKTAIQNLNADETNWREKADAYMTQYVQNLDHYLNDEVYCCTVYEWTSEGKPDKKTKPDDWKAVDTMSEFFGDDMTKNDMIEYIGFGFKEAFQNGSMTYGRAKPKKVIEYTFEYK